MSKYFQEYTCTIYLDYVPDVFYQNIFCLSSYSHLVQARNYCAKFFMILQLLNGGIQAALKAKGNLDRPKPACTPFIISKFQL